MKLMDIGSMQGDHLIKALCNTLLPSLWQGVILAVIAGLIVIFTKKASAAMRYNLLTAALLLFTVGTVVTFVAQLQAQAVAAPIHLQLYSGASSPVSVNPTVIAVAPAEQAPAISLTQRVTGYFNTHYNLIVIIWFLIICAKSIQMGVGVYGVYHLKRSKLSPAGTFWTERLAQLIEALRIKQAVRLVESGLAKVPMVVGHLKPVILVPVGLINALSAEEVEAILLHELAHIRRRDYLVNFLQSFMEIIFFFNPAVLWLSQLIRAERENCCDDIAVAQMGNRFNYMNALVNCHEYQGQTPVYGLAFAGNKGSLLTRIKRMVNNRNQSLNMFEKAVLTICLVALGLGISAFAARKDIKQAVKSIVASIHHETTAQKIRTGKNDATKNGQATPVNNANGLQPEVHTLSSDTSKSTGSPALDALVHKVDSLKALSLNGNLPALKGNFGISDTTWKTRSKPTLKIFHDIGLELYRERLLTDTTHMNISLNEKELIVNGVRMPAGVHARIYNQFGRKGEHGFNGGDYRAAYNYLPSDGPEGSSIIVPDFGDTLMKYGVIKDKRFTEVAFSRHGLIINGVKQPDEVCQMLLKKYGDNVNIHYTNNGQPDKRMQQQAYWADRHRKIVDEMQREGLIDNRKYLSFSLTDKKFVINGVEQSDEVFQRYRQEYVPANAGDGWNWSYNSPQGGYQASANGYRNSDAYYRQSAEERKRVEADRDKKLVADLLQDGLIADPDNVTFTLNQKDLTINGKKQREDTYQKYKAKYVPHDNGGDWSWTYSHHK